MENTNSGDSHVHGAIAGIVMLAAIFTTYTTYNYYQDDKLASNYEADQTASDQTASAIMSLRFTHMNMVLATSTATTTATSTKDKKIIKKIEVKI